MLKAVKPRYQAYLMRFWEEGETDNRQQTVWRFSLEDPHSGERLGFGTLEALTAFLQAQTTGEERESG